MEHWTVGDKVRYTINKEYIGVVVDDELTKTQPNLVACEFEEISQVEPLKTFKFRLYLPKEKLTNLTELNAHLEYLMRTDNGTKKEPKN